MWWLIRFPRNLFRYFFELCDYRTCLAYRLMPQGHAIFDCSPIEAAGHVIPQSYVWISVGCSDVCHHLFFWGTDWINLWYFLIWKLRYWSFTRYLYNPACMCIQHVIKVKSLHGKITWQRSCSNQCLSLGWCCNIQGKKNKILRTVTTIWLCLIPALLVACKCVHCAEGTLICYGPYGNAYNFWCH